MFKRKPSPEMEAIKAVWDEIREAEAERKAAMARLFAKTEETRPQPAPRLIWNGFGK